MLSTKEVKRFMKDNAKDTLCDNCQHDCSSQSTPPRLTTKYGRTLKCQDYIKDEQI